ncbi:MAG: hypothetical protein WJ306_04700 [Ferrovum myxofaciens]
MKGILSNSLGREDTGSEGQDQPDWGFDGYTVGNTREVKRMLDLMGWIYTILADNSESI